MHTMRERAAESNQRKIECPFCRVSFSADDEQSTPRFRYAECLADKLVIVGYDALAFMGGFFYAVNYTAWRLEIYATRYTLNGWPQLLNSIDLTGCPPKITKTEIQALVYRCPKGKHLLSSCDHITFHMDLDKMIAESIPRDHQYDGSNLIFASNTEKWYMDGDNLIRSFGKAKQKQLVITNWTSVTP